MHISFVQELFPCRVWLLNNAKGFHHRYWFSSRLRIRIFQAISLQSFSVKKDITRCSFLEINVLFWSNTESVLIKFFVHSKVIHRVLIVKTIILAFLPKFGILITLFTPFCVLSSIWTHFCYLRSISFNFFFTIFTTWHPKIRSGWICPFQINTVH